MYYNSFMASRGSRKEGPRRPARTPPSDGDAPAPEPATRAERKDRLIQARVPRELESTVKAEAERRRLSVSHLIRSVLEDAFDLVDDVVADVDQIVSDSMHLARNVGRNARRMASAGTREDPPERSSPDLDHIAAWNEVTLNRPVSCSQCADEIGRGARGYVGLSDDASAERAWLCARCVEAL